ncbi:hypothetical protein [Sedimentitalea sp.]|uniref:hypothetical protein n=1 Tax=Sedimentitalea sp. TaxID=2048915 RepID=UPI003298AD26
MGRFTQVPEWLAPLPVNGRLGFIDLLRQIHGPFAAVSKNEFIPSTLNAAQGLSRRFWRYLVTDEDQRFCTALFCAMFEGLNWGDTDALPLKSKVRMTY